jgi:hypothetical protein
MVFHAPENPWYALHYADETEGSTMDIALDLLACHVIPSAVKGLVDSVKDQAARYGGGGEDIYRASDYG